jgi:retron-type reverse transcriptase
MTATSGGFRLSAASLDWALAHVEAFGDTDIFPVPFEYQAIRHSWKEVRDHLCKADLFTWVMRPYRRCLSPKHRFGFRISTQLDPLDQLIFSALVYDIGRDIEKSRIPVSDAIVHSFRFSPDKKGRLFDPANGYQTFRTRSITLAMESACKTVVMADIADFFPRIYSHPLENALRACTAKSGYATVIKKLINQWNHSVSYGVPVGPAASRLLAELAINDVDAALLSENYKYCRYSDDFRIFCRDQRQAYEALSYLARVLFENHGLTLQQNKTRILDADDFVQLNKQDEVEKERQSLADRFIEILQEVGVNDWYGQIDYESLPKANQEEIDSLNLADLLEEQLWGDEDYDIMTVRFILRRLRQVGRSDAVDLIMHTDSEVRLYPVLKDALEYLRAVKDIDATRRHEIGKWLLDLVDNSVLGHLEYHRCWILNTFSQDDSWDNEKRFLKIMQRYADSFTQTESISAMGRAHQSYWFKSMKRNFQQLPPWERRAFIAAASCLPGDEWRYWYQSVKPQLDILEEAVARWALASPY